jgi:hypothetical protein
MQTTTTERRKFTPPEVARRFGVAVDKILAWIRSGELRAIDASTRRAARPRYLVDVEDLEAFERSRQVTPPAPRAKRRRRVAAVREYF